MLQKLQQELDQLPDNFIVSVVMPSLNYKDVNMHMLEYFINKKQHSCVYVSVNRPFQHVIQTLDSKNIDHSSIFFIDCITKKLGGESIKKSNVHFLDSPQNLTDLGIELHESTTGKGNDKNKFVYIDSLSTLCIHNNMETMQKFIHYLTGKIRLWGINGVMLSLHEDMDPKLLSELSQFCDKVIHLR